MKVKIGKQSEVKVTRISKTYGCEGRDRLTNLVHVFRWLLTKDAYKQQSYFLTQGILRYQSQANGKYSWLNWSINYRGTMRYTWHLL